MGADMTIAKLTLTAGALLRGKVRTVAAEFPVKVEEEKYLLSSHFTFTGELEDVKKFQSVLLKIFN